jgi:hypothetical protein
MKVNILPEISSIYRKRDEITEKEMRMKETQHCPKGN